MTRCKSSLVLFGVVALAALNLGGCAWFGGESTAGNKASIEPFQSPAPTAIPAPTEPPTASQPSERPKRAALPQYIEVTWEIPAEKVESYVIRYGVDKDHLDKEARLKPGDVQKVHHERYGDVYRYLLPNPPRDQTVYVSVAAVSGGHESAPSKVFEVAPDVKDGPGSARSSENSPPEKTAEPAAR